MALDHHITHTNLMQNEQILVVPTTTLFPENSTGFIEGNFDHYAQKIILNSLFIQRAQAEQDPAFQQIIPYLVFMHDNHFFMMQRKETAGEQRLKNKLTLGIGGHIRAEDFNLGSSIIDWAQREFEEEIEYHGSVVFKPLGIIRQTTTPVDQVHTGFVYLLEGDSPHISVKEELKSGRLVTLAECKQRFADFEGWSQLIIDYLISKK